MSSSFKRTITFNVEGEINDNTASPESIINNYTWSFEYNEDGNIQIFGHHNNNKGRITNISHFPKTTKSKKDETKSLLRM